MSTQLCIIGFAINNFFSIIRVTDVYSFQFAERLQLVNEYALLQKTRRRVTFIGDSSVKTQQRTYAYS